MVYSDNIYISTQDLLFQGVLRDIKKSRNSLQPVFEAFTNSLEAIKIKERLIENFRGKITIEIFASETTLEHSEFNYLIIRDNGIGFDDKEFRRFNTFKDFTKGFKNLGSGRIQYAHYFDSTTIKSLFEIDDKFYEREFIVSKKDSFIAKNAIVYHNYCKEVNTSETETVVKFDNLLEQSKTYNELTDITLKNNLLERYIHYFCYNVKNLPNIDIKFFVQSKLKSECKIKKSDIPKIDKTQTIELPYSRIALSGKSIEKTNKTEEFCIDAFKIEKNILKENRLKLVSKGEIVEDSNLELQSLGEKDSVNGNKFLFLVSSEYIDSRDTNLRGELNIPNKENISKHLNLFSSEEIFLEDIQDEINTTIRGMYPEIEIVKQKYDEQIEKLKEMFLLDEETINTLKISINDNEAKILEKFYEAEAKKTAKVDASIKESIDKLDSLDTTSENYDDELMCQVEELVKTIPLQNKTDLTHYVARRKLVLELFDKILKRKLEVQLSQKKNFDEALIHNLLFQQGSNNPEESDLWIINEDFIYFKGSSEKQLSKLTINGERVFKEVFSEEEEKYLTSLGEDRKIKRPDVLLFPDEGKCIIIEFKAPHVNAANHLTQIDRYANLILNYTEEKFNLNTFYGYLIGESIEPRDVLGYVSSYEHSYHFDYIYRPAEKVVGFDDRKNGAIYTEVLKYSTLLERAKRRNKIFIEKLNSRK
jgi:hypothetical protein